MNAPPIPEFIAALALREGVSEALLPRLWRKHCEWMAGRNENPGGKPWIAFCRSAAAREAEAPTVDVATATPMLIAMRKAERDAKALEEAEYLKTAISFQDFCGTIAAAWDMREAQTPAEERIGEVVDRRGLPGRHEDPIGWLLAKLENLDVQRRQDCPCGQPARTWVHRNRRYWGAICEACSAREQAAKKTQKAQGAA